MIGILVVKGATIYDSIPAPQGPLTTKVIRQESIRYSMLWAYFDGASNINGHCEASLIIHLSKGNIVKTSVGLGQVSNNFAEMKALHFLLC